MDHVVLCQITYNIFNGKITQKTNQMQKEKQKHLNKQKEQWRRGDSFKKFYFQKILIVRLCKFCPQGYQFWFPYIMQFMQLYLDISQIQNCIEFKMVSPQQDLISKPILYALYLKTQLSKMNCIWYLILPSQIICFIFYSLHEQIFIGLAKKFGNETAMREAITWFFDILYSTDIIRIIICTAFSLSICLLLMAILFMVIKKRYNEFDDRYREQQRLIAVTAIVVNVYQFTLPAIILGMKLTIIKAIRQDLSSHEYLIYFLPLIFISLFFVLAINKRFRVLGQSWILVPILLTGYWDDEHNTIESQVLIIVSLSIIILMSLVEIFIDEEHQFLNIKGINIRKICHWEVFAMSVWKLSWTIETQNSLEAANVIYLFIIIVLVMLASSLGATRKEKKLKNFIILCELINKLAKGTIKQSEKLDMFSIVIEISHKIQSKENQKDENFMKMNAVLANPQEIENWIKFADELAEYEYKEDSSLKTGLTIIKMKIIIGDQLTSILTLFQSLVQKFTEKTISNQYQILKVAIKIHEAYFSKHEIYEIPLVQIILQVNKLRDEFYAGLKKSMEEYIQFWDLLPHRSVQRIEQKIIFLSDNFNYLRRVLNKIEKYSSISRERHLLSFLTQKIFNYYNQEENVQFSYELKKQNYEEIFIVKNGVIESVSAKLANELQYEKYQINNQSVYEIMPKYFYDSVSRLIKKSETPSVQIPFMLPFVCSDGSFILRNAICYIKVSLEVGYVYVFCLQKNISDKLPALIYQKSSNLIKGYNKKFVEVFELDKHQLKSKIKSNLLNLEEMFKNLEQFQEQTRSKKHSLDSNFQKQYNCMLSLEKLITSKVRKTLIGVKLSIIQSYQGYFLIRVAEGNSNKSVIINYRSKSMISEQIVRTHGDGNYETHIEDGISCPIQNPYKLKLTLTKNNIRKKKSFRKHCLVSVFLLGSLIVLSVLCLVSNEFNKESKDELLNVVDNKEKIWKIIKSLYLGYQNFYERYVYDKTSHGLIKFQLDSEILQQKLTKQLSNVFEDFKYLYFKKNEEAPNVNIFSSDVQEIKIQFKNFNLTVSPNGLNLMDYAQHLFLQEGDHALYFNLMNYKNFRKIWQYVTENSSTFKEMEESYNLKIIITLISCSIIFFPFIIAAICMMQELESLISDMEEILFMIEPQSKQQARIKFEKIQAIIYESKSRLLKEEDGTNQSISNVSQEIKTPALNFQMKKTGKNLATETQEIVFAEEQEELSDSKEEELQSQKNLQQFKVEEPSGSSDRVINVQSKKKNFVVFFPVLFVLTFLGCIVLFFILPQEKLSSYSKVYDFIAEENKIYIKNIESQTNILHEVIYQQFFGTPDPIADETTVDLINEKELPEEFANFSVRVIERNSIDLCQLKDDLVMLFDEYDIPRQLCPEVLGGILSLGLPKSFLRIKNKFNEVRENGVHTLCESYTFEKYPLIYELNFGMNLIKIDLDLYQEQFKTEFQKFRQSEETDNKNITLICIGYILVSLLLLGLITQIMRKKSQIGIGYFLIVENESLLKAEILKFIRDNKILERLNKL